MKMGSGLKFKIYSIVASTILATTLQAGSVATEKTETLTVLEVIGNQKQTKETILLRSGLKNGDRFDTIDFTQVLNKLWDTNLYDNIKLETASEKEGKKIIIRVQERPTIKEVSYLGGKKLGITTIKEKIKENGLTVNTNSTYNPETIYKIKKILIDLASNKGFMDPIVDVIIEPLGPATSKLTFDIKVGKKTKIQQIAFQGNKTISEAKLRSIITERHTSWFMKLIGQHKELTKKDIDENIENIKREYWKLGYKDIIVGESLINSLAPTIDKRKNKLNKNITKGKDALQNARIKLTIPINEGEYFTKGTLKIESDDQIINGHKIQELYHSKVIDTRRERLTWIERLLKFKKTSDSHTSSNSRPFDMESINKIVDEILEDYNDKGYIRCLAQKKLDVVDDAGTKRVDVLINIDKNEQFTVNRINFEGNIKTKDKILRRSMMINEGNIFNTDSLRDSLARLSQLGYFNIKQNPKLDPLVNAPKVDITIIGEESSTNSLTLKGGFGSVDGFSIGGSVSTDNLNGKGQALGVNFDTSTSSRIMSVVYTEPFLMDTPYSITTALSSESINYAARRKEAADSGKRHTRSLSVSGQTKLSTFLPKYNWAYFTSCSVGYQLHLTKADANNSCYLRHDKNRWQLMSSLNQSIDYSTINHPFHPTSGQSVKLKLEYGGWQFGTDMPFFKTTVDYKKLFAVDKKSTLYFYANCGYVKIKKSNSGEHNVINRYRPGGEDSVRGFTEGGVGPTVIDCNDEHVFVGGDRQLITNLEYQFKVNDLLQVVLFHDLGQAWANGASVRKQALRRSAGVELRLFLPISPAPIRFIWARKLNKYPFDIGKSSDFQFSIGTSF